MDLKNQVLSLLKEVAPEIDPSEIDMKIPLREQVDIDSMDFLNFIGRIYEVLGVNIPESDYAKLSSLEDLLSYLDAKRGSFGRETV